MQFCHVFDWVMKHAKKWPPAFAGGLPWSVYPFRLLQQGAGERIPVAAFKLGYTRGLCQGEFTSGI